MKFISSIQPASYGQLIKQSLALYRASFSNILLLAVLFSITVFIPRLISDIVGQDIFAILEPFSLYRLWMIAIYVAALIFFIAILWHMHCVIINKHEPLIQDFFIGLKKAFYALTAAILQSMIVFAFGLIIYGLLILLHHLQLLFIHSLFGIVLTTFIFFGQFILLLYISTLFIFLVPLIAIENKGVFRALEKSILLVWNHWWRVFSLQLTPWIFYVTLLVVLKYFLNIDVHIYFIQKNQFEIWITLINILIFALYIPWVAATLLLQLKDLEIRKKFVHSSKHK